jgi:hypothetical protein
MREPIPADAFLASCDPPLRGVAEAIRVVVRATWPAAEERVRPGWHVIGYDLPVGRKTVFAAWIWPQAEHVHLGFVRGVLMRDPKRRLDGAGVTKQARWLTFVPGDPVDPRTLAPLLQEAARVASMSPDERYAAEQALLAG